MEESWERDKKDRVIFIDEITEMRECHTLTSVAGRQIVLKLGPCDPSSLGSPPTLPREERQIGIAVPSTTVQ